MRTLKLLAWVVIALLCAGGIVAASFAWPRAVGLAAVAVLLLVVSGLAPLPIAIVGAVIQHCIAPDLRDLRAWWGRRKA